MAFDTIGISRTENTRFDFTNTYLVSLDGIYILDSKKERVGILIEEYFDLEQAFNDVCDKRDEYKELLIQHGIIEREYTKEELEEMQREQDRQTLMDNKKAIDDLTNLVSQLIDINKKDKEELSELKNGKKNVAVTESAKTYKTSLTSTNNTNTNSVNEKKNSIQKVDAR